MPEKSSFEILKEMSEKNMDIQLAPLDNIIRMDVKGDHGEILIGVPKNVVMRFMNEKFVGGLILANAEQFTQLQNEHQ